MGNIFTTDTTCYQILVDYDVRDVIQFEGNVSYTKFGNVYYIDSPIIRLELLDNKCTISKGICPYTTDYERGYWSMNNLIKCVYIKSYSALFSMCPDVSNPIDYASSKNIDIVIVN